MSFYGIWRSSIMRKGWRIFAWRIFGIHLQIFEVVTEMKEQICFLLLQREEAEPIGSNYKKRGLEETLGRTPWLCELFKGRRDFIRGCFITGFQAEGGLDIMLHHSETAPRGKQTATLPTVVLEWCNATSPWISSGKSRHSGTNTALSSTFPLF